MRYYLTGLCLAFLCLTARAQTAYPDLIVTNNGDSIRCQFMKIDTIAINYWRLGATGKPVKDIIPRPQINIFIKWFYARREAGPGGTPSAQPQSFYQPKSALRKPWYFGIEMGYGHWLGNLKHSAFTWGVPRDRKKDGFCFSLLSGYMIHPQLGLGVRLEYFTTPRVKSLTESTEKITTAYLGLDAVGELPLNPANTWRLTGSLGAGMLATQDLYEIHSTPNVEPYTIQYSGSAIATRAEAGIWYQQNKSIAWRATVHGMAANATYDFGKTSASRVGATLGWMATF